MGDLTKNFSLSEFVESDTAKRLGIDNTPTKEAKENIKVLARAICQPCRDALGMPIRISSGYRSWQLNTAVGGSKTSQHAKGEAVDLVCADNRRLFNYILENLTFDQLIWEEGSDAAPAWVHVSYTTDRVNRMQVLRIKGGKVISKTIKRRV